MPSYVQSRRECSSMSCSTKHHSCTRRELNHCLVDRFREKRPVGVAFDEGAVIFYFNSSSRFSLILRTRSAFD